MAGVGGGGGVGSGGGGGGTLAMAATSSSWTAARMAATMVSLGRVVMGVDEVVGTSGGGTSRDGPGASVGGPLLDFDIDGVGFTVETRVDKRHEGSPTDSEVQQCTDLPRASLLRMCEPPAGLRAAGALRQDQSCG